MMQAPYPLPPSPVAYYQHSGKAPPAGLAMGLAGGLAAGVVLAFVYAYATAYIPVVGYFTFILSAAFGGGVGAAAAWLMRTGKVRNPGLTLAVGALCTAAALYVAWTAWIGAVLARANVNVGALDLLLDPSTFVTAVLRINEVGAWSLRGGTPTGVLLWVLWSAEAVIVIGAGALAAGALGGMDPFCEACGTWCSEVPAAAMLPPVDAGELKRRLEARDWAWVAQGAQVFAPGPASTKLDLHSCPKCGATHTLTASHVVHKVDDKGNPADEATLVVDRLLLAPHDAAAARAAGAAGAHAAPSQQVA